jgi:uncharacterized protein YciI
MVDNSTQSTLQKAKLQPIDSDVEAVEFMYNPANIKWQLKVKWESKNDSGSDNPSLTYGGGEARTVTLSNIIFDTLESREDVRGAHIDKLERLAQRDAEGKHVPPDVLLLWGQFMTETDGYNSPKWKVESIDLDYTMFLPSGLPVRCNTTITLKECTPEWEQQEQRPNQSPDHSKLVTVRRGDTLQSISNATYDTPVEWRRIAEANGIEDPMELIPGAQLMIPPILK